MINKIDERALAIFCAVQVAIGEMFNNLKERGENGQTLVEYGVIILLVAIAVFVVVSQFGGAIKNVFKNITGGLNNTNTP